MKLMIASDIHGSAKWCEKLLNRYDDEKPDKLVLLGDILYHGPRNDLPEEYAPKKVIEMLNGIGKNILCVRGNCDTEVDQMVLNFPIMADYAVAFWGDRMIYMTHGHVINMKNLPALNTNDFVLHGHTHVPAFEKTDMCIYLNPGSVSIPKENSAHGYMVISDDRIEYKDLDGNTYRTVLKSEI